jgi:hypothetical protein
MSGYARDMDSDRLDAGVGSQPRESCFNFGEGESASEVWIRESACQFGQDRFRDDQGEYPGTPAAKELTWRPSPLAMPATLEASTFVSSTATITRIDALPHLSLVPRQ